MASLCGIVIICLMLTGVIPATSGMDDAWLWVLLAMFGVNAVFSGAGRTKTVKVKTAGDTVTIRGEKLRVIKGGKTDG